MGESCPMVRCAAVAEPAFLSSWREWLLMTDACRWRGCGEPARAEREADRANGMLGGGLGMDGPACWVVVADDEFGNQLTCDGRLCRLSDEDEESSPLSRNTPRECVRRFRDGVRSTSRPEPAGKKLAMSY